MADMATFKVTVLWGAELRAAAAAIAALRDKKEVKDDAEFARLHVAAINACAAALHGLVEHPDSHLVVCEAERGTFVPRVTNIVRPEPKGGV